MGLIEGRSRSVDITSFVGVRVVSWDDPIFEPGAFSPANAGQLPQITRLLNQKVVSFMAILIPETAATISQTEADSKKGKAAPRQLLHGNFLDVFHQSAAWRENQASPFSTFGFVPADGRAFHSATLVPVFIGDSFIDDHRIQLQKMGTAANAISGPQLKITPVYLAAYLAAAQYASDAGI